MNNNRGFILLLAFILMIPLTFLAGYLLYLVTSESRDIAAQIEDVQLLNLAEAGVQRAKREIRDDYLSTTQTGVAELRGAVVSETGSVGSQDNIQYEEDGNATIDCTYGVSGCLDAVFLSGFDANYTNTRIISVFLGAFADRQGAGGAGATATLEVSYSTDGNFPQAGNTVLSATLTTVPTYYEQDITNDRVWTWGTIMNSNFTIRARRTADFNDRNVLLDYLYLKIVYEIDTNTEPWFTGSYQAYPITLGTGTIQSVSITAEQGKVHLNTATQGLLRYLMVENGIGDPAASQVATNIINYRNTPNQFDTIEELRQVAGVTQTIYDAIDQDITVYSFINGAAVQPTAPRAPVNINTASPAVLEAIFDPLTFSSPSDIPNLAGAIIAQRNIAPFTCFYSSDTNVTTDFYDFERSQSYLSNAEDDRVLGNADASSLIPRQGGTLENALTTEFAYDTNAFYISSLVNIGGAGGRNYRVKTILGDSGATTFTTFSGDSTSVGWRKENFE